MGIDSLKSIFNRAKPFLGVIFLQFVYAGNFIVVKSALNKDMSQHVLVVYRHAIATLFISPFALVLERKIRPKMTFSTFFKILLLGLLEPTIDQNLYNTGMKYTTATFATAMSNVTPAIAFMMAWTFRLEKVNLRKLHSLLKILGTIVTIGGAMLMTLLTGPVLHLPWTKVHNVQQAANSSVVTKQDPVKGAILMGTGCFCWSGFIILQAITLKSYPAPLSLTALICCMGTIEGIIFALGMEKGNSEPWSIHLDIKLLAYIYCGVATSALGYYIQGVILKVKGPVFVTAFSPLSMVIVAILGSFVLSEITYLGRITGAIVIVAGLYFVLWGKSKDQLSPDKAAAVATENQQKDINNEWKLDFAMDVTSKVEPEDENV
ncbi:hypothetical protein SLE2022_109110 [Rubroshorea leprosula]